MLARVGRVAKISNHSNHNILSPKEMLQILPIALTPIKAGNKSENLLNEIGQIINFYVEQKNY